MARKVHAERNNLTWKVRRVWVPEAVRPIGPRQIHAGSARPSQYAGLGVLLSPLFAVVGGIPTLAVLLPLRFAKLASWRIEAVARPWGRGGPAYVLAWRVKGWEQGPGRSTRSRPPSSAGRPIPSSRSRGATISRAALPVLLFVLAAGAVQGCGGGGGAHTLPRATRDRPDDLRGKQIHFVYAVPAGGANRDQHRDTDGTLTNATYLLISWLSRQTGSPRLRIDMYRGQPDITFVRLPHTGAFYERNGPSALGAAVAAAGLRSSGKRYAVYYEGKLPQSEANICGLGLSGPHAFAIVYLAQSCAYDFGDVAFGYHGGLVFVMAHEVLHELGFVPACAPHALDDSGHVGDSRRDLMYPILGTGVPVLDVNNDDYYLAGVPGCPDLSRSPYLVLP